MDEFSHFYNDNGFGPAEHIEPAAPSLLGEYQDKVPGQLVTHWSAYGFCSYGQGLFWTVNPAAYTSLIPLWLKDTGFLEHDEYSVIARNAFGRLYLWGKSSGQSIKIECAWGSIFPKDQTQQISAGRGDILIQRFFGGQQKKSVDLEDDQGKLLFQRALRTLGPLASNEMYGFEPPSYLAAALSSKTSAKSTSSPISPFSPSSATARSCATSSGTPNVPASSNNKEALTRLYKQPIFRKGTKYQPRSSFKSGPSSLFYRDEILTFTADFYSPYDNAFIYSFLSEAGIEKQWWLTEGEPKEIWRIYFQEVS